MKTIEELKKDVNQNKKQIDLLKSDLLKVPIKKTQNQINEIAKNVWTKSNCLDCANCCKNISPILELEDIHRMASYIKIKAGDFIKQYVEMDEDGDFVFKSTPCPMLENNNKCNVYEARPKACAEYPHLDQIISKKMLKLAFENINYCGVVYETLSEVDKRNDVI